MDTSGFSDGEGGTNGLATTTTPEGTYYTPDGTRGGAPTGITFDDSGTSSPGDNGNGNNGSPSIPGDSDSDTGKTTPPSETDGGDNNSPGPDMSLDHGGHPDPGNNYVNHIAPQMRNQYHYTVAPPRNAPYENTVNVRNHPLANLPSRMNWNGPSAIFQRYNDVDNRFPGISIYTYTGENYGGVCLAPFVIFVHKDLSQAWVEHEYGHFLYYQHYGALNYWTKVAPQSKADTNLLSKGIITKLQYDSKWYEVKANILAIQFLGKNASMPYDNSGRFITEFNNYIDAITPELYNK